MIADRARGARTAVRREHGFTLLELMVVLLIIGVIVSFASLSIGDRALDDRLEAESKRIEQLLNLAEEEADLTGAPIGVRFDKDGYHFLSADSSRGWVDYAHGGVLRSRPLAQPFVAELTVEGRKLPPVATAGPATAAATPANQSEGTKKEDEPATSSSADGDRQDGDSGLTPQILLLPGQQMTPFELDLRAPNYPSWFRISGDALGRITRTREPEPQRKAS